jgi:hypothetical protein
VSQDEPEPTDPDRAAILARRRRFIALAISGLATGGCRTQPPQPCLSVPPNGGINADGDGEGINDEGNGEAEPNASGPFVEDPGAPVDIGDTDGPTGGDTGETGEAPPEPNPQPCLRMRPTPTPCLMIMNNGRTRT